MNISSRQFSNFRIMGNQFFHCLDGLFGRWWGGIQVGGVSLRIICGDRMRYCNSLLALRVLTVFLALLVAKDFRLLVRCILSLWAPFYHAFYSPQSRFAFIVDTLWSYVSRYMNTTENFYSKDGLRGIRNFTSSGEPSVYLTDGISFFKAAGKNCERVLCGDLISCLYEFYFSRPPPLL